MRKIVVLLLLSMIGMMGLAFFDEARIKTGGNMVLETFGVPPDTTNLANMVNFPNWYLSMNVDALLTQASTPLNVFSFTVFQPYSQGFAGYIKLRKTLQASEGYEFTYAVMGYIRENISYGLAISWCREPTASSTPVDALELDFGLRGMVGGVTAYHVYIKNFTLWSSRGMVEIGDVGAAAELLEPVDLVAELGVKRGDVWYAGAAGGFNIAKILYAQFGATVNVSLSSPNKSTILLGGGVELLLGGFDMSLGITGAVSESGGGCIPYKRALTFGVKTIW